MRQYTHGFSTLSIALTLMIASVLLGGFYYMNGQARTALTDKKQVIYPSKKLVPTGVSGKKVITAGECDTVGANPNLSNRFKNTDADSCGSLPAGAARPEALDSIKLCIDSAINTCKQTKSYIYQQGFEGSVEYLITTNNCEIFVERWGTADPYCGSSINSCDKLSENFPDEICPEFIKDEVVLPSPTGRTVTKVPQQTQGTVSCNSVVDCTGKLTCDAIQKNDSCDIDTACINNECTCIEVCE